MQILTTAVAATGLFLIPFGNVSELVRSQKPWNGFFAQDPILWVVRAQEVKTSDCQKWVQALVEDSPKPVLNAERADLGLSDLAQPGSPWFEKDKEPVTDCDGFPCAVKLNSSEAKQMEKVSEDKRFQKYLSLVKDRLSLYLKSQVRQAYEFPGKPMDPWELFDKKGFRTSLKRPDDIKLWARKIEFASNKTKPIHQILDWRATKSSSGLEAAVWMRDVYTDHYFDSWGEWLHVSCSSAQAKSVQVVQGLVVELDLLKKTDLLSKMMKGKMRSAVQEGGTPHLEKQFNRLKAQVQKSGSGP
jgi:hypothetical protein